jgi:hypothetical protein
MINRCTPLPLIALWLSLATAIASGDVRFNRDIRPILSENCFYCHGQDTNHRKAELRLDIREEALKKLESGFAPIVPGKPEESELIKRINSTDQDEQMPPPKAHRNLSPQQKEIFQAMDRRGGNVRAPLGVRSPRAAGTARDQNGRLGEKPDRPIRARETGTRRAGSVAGSRSRDIDSAGDARSDWTATDS